MSTNTYLKVSGTVFILVAIVHLLRVINDWGVMVNAMPVPMWASWIALIAGSYLSLTAFKAASR